MIYAWVLYHALTSLTLVHDIELSRKLKKMLTYSQLVGCARSQRSELMSKVTWVTEAIRTLDLGTTSLCVKMNAVLKVSRLMYSIYIVVLFKKSSLAVNKQFAGQTCHSTKRAFLCRTL